MAPAPTPENLAHLLRRAGFGATRTEIDAAASAGIAATVDRLLAAPGDVPQNPPVPQLTMPDPSLRNDPTIPADQKAAVRKQQRQQFRAEGIRLTGWWIQNMATTPAPLVEKLTLVWHGWLCSALDKVKVPAAMHNQNTTFRSLGRGPFPALVKAISRDPAMVHYLDLDKSRVGAVNENFARELMELFTLGPGNYSQRDVSEVARVFTGTVLSRQAGMQVRPRLVDSAPKTIFGATGTFSGDQVIDAICSKRASAEFVATRMWANFAAPDPSAAIVARLADAYEQGGRRIDALLRAMFTADEFYTPEVRTGLVKTPVEFVVGTLRAFGMRIDDGSVAPQRVVAALRLMGQQPYLPPNVGGWPQNRYWTNTAMTQARFTVAGALARKVPPDALPRPGDRASVQVLLDRLGMVSPRNELVDALVHLNAKPADVVQLALASPDYQLA